MMEKALFFQGPWSSGARLPLRVLALGFVLALGLPLHRASAQVLHVETLRGGTKLVLVAQTEATATAVAWPERGPEGRTLIRSTASGELSLARDLATAFDGAAVRPPVAVAVGAAARDELVGALEGALGSLPLAPMDRGSGAPVMDEGGVERRLGKPGSEATLRLELPLPPLKDGRRTAVELLLDLAPGLLTGELPGLRRRTGPDSVTLEATVDAASADLYLARLRRGLAQLGDNPGLDAAAVDRARRRLRVARRADLEELEEGARHLVTIWLAGGEEGIRQYLFGVEGAGLEGVRVAASTWLARHPGRATILLPPQSLNPRFAGGPTLVVLDSGLSVALLERPATPLTVLCLRPVTTPDLAGERTATVLTRLAGLLRRSGNAPAWIRVVADPPSLLVAAAPDGFAEALESLTEGLREVGADTGPLPASRDPRSVALQLMAPLVGVDQGELTPARLLAPGNLALGAVVPDAERATEALHKLMDVLAPTTRATAVNLEGSQRHVAPLPGSRSAMAVLLPLDPSTGEVVVRLAAALLQSRAREVFGADTAWMLRPDIPGRRVLLLVVEADGTVDVLEKAVAAAWASLTAPPTDAELASLRHRVGSAIAIQGSGTAGAAARCARLAAVGGGWRRVDELERAALAIEPGMLGAVFQELGAWGHLEKTAAGPLPVGSLDLPER